MNPKTRRYQTDLRLHGVDDGMFTIKLAALMGLVSGAMWLGLHGSWAGKGLSWVILGGMFAHAVELQHQALHHTAFQSKRLNRIVGFLLGMPMLISFTEYQTSHLRHHRLIGTPEDQESFDYDYQSLSGVLAWLCHLFMLRHYGRKLRTLVGSLLPVARSQSDAHIRTEYRLMFYTIVVGIALSIVLKTTVMLEYWLLPLVLVAAPLHVLIELPEHVGCQ